ncbi:MAG TPA: hypothetical protein VG248_00975 [Caulobacteraceae bacterium]|jgi:hypothetical protein|nr:hypothetical protein [Caulobacteraceae bacterium]
MPQDLQARRLRAFDQTALQFERSCRRRAQAGDLVALRDIGILSALADAVASDVEGWRGRVQGLDLAGAAPLDVPLTCQVIAEWMADCVLDAEAAGVFAAALDISAAA